MLWQLKVFQIKGIWLEVHKPENISFFSNFGPATQFYVPLEEQTLANMIILKLFWQIEVVIFKIWLKERISANENDWS